MNMISQLRCYIPALALISTLSLTAQTITIDPQTQRFIGSVSDLDRGKYFTLHSGTGDADIQQFYADYNAFEGRGFWGPFSYANQQTGVVGQYPGPISGSSGVRSVRSNYVATEHPSNVIRYNLDTNAAADWVVEYYKDYVSNGSAPEFFEPMNEPFVHAGDAVFQAQQPDAALMRTRMAEWFGAIGQKVDQTPELANMKIIGYSSAWPSMELWDFGHWNSRQKMFMDVAGAHMDAFSTHLYDGVNVTGQSSERSGSNSEAILDIIEAYSFIKWGVVKSHAITEHGGIASGYPAGWNDLEAVQSVSSSNKLIFNLLDRADRMAISIPFITDKSTWHITAANNYEPYGAVLMRPTNLGQPNPTGWVYTPKILFYEMWKDVKGKRVYIHSTHPDIQSHAFADGNKLYVALNNLDDVSQFVNLDFASTLPGIQNVRIKRLKVYEDTPHEFTDTNQSSAPGSITMVADETVVLEYTFQSTPQFSNNFRSQNYYTNKYLQAISANNTISFTFNGVQTGTGLAKLKMGIGRKHDKSKQPIVTVNGTTVVVPNNWKGYDQANRSDFFGVIDIPVPMSLLQSNNTVTVQFPDSGGHLSSLILEVGKYDFTPAANQTPYGGVAHQIPGTIEGKNFDLGGQGVAYHDTHSWNNGGLYRSEGVDLGSGDGDVVVGWTAGGEWLEYTVNANPGVYDIEARISAPSNNRTIIATLDGKLLGTFTLPNTGAWHTYQTISLQGVPIDGGNNQVLRLEFPSGGLNLRSLTFIATGAGTLTTSEDIGSPAIAGNAIQDGADTYTLTGSGSDIWGTWDRFQYAYKNVSGDHELITRVDFLENTNTWAKAGVMFRDSSAGNSKFVMVMVRPDKQVTMQWRDSTGGSAAWNSALLGGTTSIKWLRLVKSGNNFTGYYSTDGVNWTTILTKSVTMTNSPLAGLCLTSHNNGTLSTAVFSNMRVW
ncbi:carbohydrate-binding domain-containing protein [Rubellicoccus peritrichatus]|uniref:DUF5010 C-terminal domain-containing protein n=1 Tax=Rubellicoccus peritrichatus TaxID=3080537 RepID=A0AAQ3QV10_9BACT|nr:carbohydrate-binding domain-containing protein [Puniceicoccus sp. CR14]WOO42976.1 DUF5010 C-terminal domain-containing protein [Puniceicoccus sp. CR14]